LGCPAFAAAASWSMTAKPCSAANRPLAPRLNAGDERDCRAGDERGRPRLAYPQSGRRFPDECCSHTPDNRATRRSGDAAARCRSALNSRPSPRTIREYRICSTSLAAIRPTAGRPVSPQFHGEALRPAPVRSDPASLRFAASAPFRPDQRLDLGPLESEHASHFGNRHLFAKQLFDLLQRKAEVFKGQYPVQKNQLIARIIAVTGMRIGMGRFEQTNWS